jgi:molybdate/tungstate transport system substrate-binding protein
VYVALILISIIGVSSILVFSAIDWINSQNRRILKVLCAASLLYPIDRAAQAFESSNPDVGVQVEGHGSIQVIRQVTELGEKADVLMVADCSLIPTMMYDTTMPESNQSYANWYIRFSTNSIVLAYSNHSRNAGVISASNWFSTLLQKDVRFGFPNPMIDALGYRALMTIQLAEAYYHNDSIFHSMITENFDPPLSCVSEGARSNIIVPDVQQPKSDKVVLRPSGIELIPLLQTGSIDYCFLYLSTARQYGFSYVQLPDQINLGNPQYESNYEQVHIEFEHQRFGTIGLDRDGKTIYYGLTIPNNSLNPDLAVKFAEYIMSGEGRTIFTYCYHPIFQPALTDNITAIPQVLRSSVMSEP